MMLNMKETDERRQNTKLSKTNSSKTGCNKDDPGGPTMIPKSQMKGNKPCQGQSMVRQALKMVPSTSWEHLRKYTAPLAVPSTEKDCESQAAKAPGRGEQLVQSPWRIGTRPMTWVSLGWWILPNNGWIHADPAYTSGKTKLIFKPFRFWPKKKKKKRCGCSKYMASPARTCNSRPLLFSALRVPLL